MKSPKPIRKSIVFVLAALLVFQLTSCSAPETPPVSPEATNTPKPISPTDMPLPTDLPYLPPAGTPPPTALPYLPPSETQETPPVGATGIAESKLPRNLSPDVPSDDLTSLAAGNRAFAFDFYQAVRSEDGNLFYSPHSISVALAMTYAGARAETEAQMAQTLHFTLPQERLHPAFNALALALDSRGQEVGTPEEGQRFQLSVANSIWGQQGFPFLSDFLDTLAVNYGSGLRLVDFTTAAEPARLEINDWVSQQTNDRIKDLIPEGGITDLTRLVLVNAIYFNASWMYPFDETLTQDSPFNLLDGSQVSAQMMTFFHPEKANYARGDGYQIVELPYLGETVAMDVLVPDAGKFADFEANLDAAQFEAILAEMKPASVALTMPKFSFDKNFNLAEALAGMGMPTAFSPGQADFSGIDGSQELSISAVFHKAFVSVDEAGTEAAAATAVMMTLTMEGPRLEQVELRIDHPFIFVIRDIPTGEILFVGRVLNPTE